MGFSIIFKHPLTFVSRCILYLGVLVQLVLYIVLFRNDIKFCRLTFQGYSEIGFQTLNELVLSDNAPVYLDGTTLMGNGLQTGVICVICMLAITILSMIVFLFLKRKPGKLDALACLSNILVAIAIFLLTGISGPLCRTVEYKYKAYSIIGSYVVEAKNDLGVILYGSAACISMFFGIISFAILLAKYYQKQRNKLI